MEPNEAAERFHETSHQVQVDSVRRKIENRATVAFGVLFVVGFVSLLIGLILGLQAWLYVLFLVESVIVVLVSYAFLNFAFRHLKCLRLSMILRAANSPAGDLTILAHQPQVLDVTGHSP